METEPRDDLAVTDLTDTGNEHISGAENPRTAPTKP